MNIPNLLSLLRICMIPLVPLVYFSDVTNGNYWAAGIYALASATDVLDGWIARKYNKITRLGRILDPLADKAMNFCVLVCLVVKELVPFWAVAIFFIKEVLMGLGALSQFKKIHDVPPSHPLGKLATMLFFLACAVIMLFPQIPALARTIAIATALALNILAFSLYLGRYVNATNRK